MVAASYLSALILGLCCFEANGRAVREVPDDCSFLDHHTRCRCFRQPIISGLIIYLSALAYSVPYLTALPSYENYNLTRELTASGQPDFPKTGQNPPPPPPPHRASP
ncbi:hypothetical protein RUM44_007164 [Polyplax serrata]|uniref:Uncharacterized protein n=1 Tax=Polyplax serrata TaxID=468196 RepID=A0ABR1B1K4_POLSC